FVADMPRLQKTVGSFQCGFIMQLLGQRRPRLRGHRVRNGNGTTIATWIAQPDRTKGGLRPQQRRQQSRWCHHRWFSSLWTHFSLRHTTFSLILPLVVDQTCDKQSGFSHGVLHLSTISKGIPCSLL